MTRTGDDGWIGDTLAQIAQPVIVRGWILAWLCLAVQVPGALLFAAFGALPAAQALFFLVHGIFVGVIADFGVRLARDPDAEPAESFGPGAFAGTLLALPPMADALLNGGMLFGQAQPWLAGYWILVSVAAAPARLAARQRGARLWLWPLWQRLPLVAPFAAPILLLPIFPVPSDGECCGLFEGGLFVLPFLAGYVGLYLFGASVTAALLSAASVRPARRA